MFIQDTLSTIVARTLGQKILPQQYHLNDQRQFREGTVFFKKLKVA